ncbi:class I SAM-dependent methyltransferase [Dyella mobilis]|nr:class I SAM-dependent methyltransferase [Dyella mobilis]GLQ98929.1 methyltransferase type 11 [Dyella mobilis]
MPEEALWATFFDPEDALDRLWPAPLGDAVELGCGFGTFTLAAARRSDGIITALDIDAEMVAAVRLKAQAQALSRIRALEHDFIAGDLAVAPGSQTHVMIYNLLHLEEPVPLLRKAYAALETGGTLSVMHWRSDVPTPRGPPLAIRPAPQACAAWLTEAGFSRIEHVDLGSGCPYHYGLTAWR